jgi:hypothetical protein
MTKAPLPLLTFLDRDMFEAWLSGQAAGAEGAWLRFAKQGAPEQTISKTEAIEAPRPMAGSMASLAGLTICSSRPASRRVGLPVPGHKPTGKEPNG